MGWLLLSFMSVSLFSLSAHGLMREVRRSLDLLGPRVYSLRAQRVARHYRIMAWATLTLFLFFSMLSSFIQTYSETFF